jgi:hypothetical protein
MNWRGRISPGVTGSRFSPVEMSEKSILSMSSIEMLIFILSMIVDNLDVICVAVVPNGDA